MQRKFLIDAHNLFIIRIKQPERQRIRTKWKELLWGRQEIQVPKIPFNFCFEHNEVDKPSAMRENN